MTAADLRAAREQLGLTPEALAALADVRAAEILAWERGEHIPRHHHYPLRLALWVAERDAALARAGIPPCAWLEAHARELEIVNPRALGEHLGRCPACLAREAYVQRHLRPMPLGGSGGGRFFGLVGWVDARLSGWQRSAAAGALIILVMGGAGVVGMLGLGVFHRDPLLLAGAGGLFLALLFSGAAGGLVHHWTRRWRALGTAGYYASWVLTLYGYLAAVLGLVLLGLYLAGEAGSLAELRAVLANPAGIGIFLALGLVFGVMTGRQTRDPAPTTTAEARHPAGFNWRHALTAVVVLAAGIVRIVAGRLEDAPPAAPPTLAELQAAVREHPDDARAHGQLARALLDASRRSEAIEEYRAAVRLDSTDAQAHVDLGWALNQFQRYREALPYLQRAVRLAPSDANAHHNLAWALLQLERYAEAEAPYREVIRLDPENHGARRELGWLLMQQGRSETALAELRAAARLQPENVETQMLLARGLLQAGRNAEAADAYRAVARLDAQNPFIYLELGRAAHLAGQHAEAVAAFEKAEALSPTILEEREELRGMLRASRAGKGYYP